MMKAIAAILLSLLVSSTALAQDSGGRSAARTSMATDVDGPLHRSAAHEAERLAKEWSTHQAQSGSRVHHPVLLGAAIGAGTGFLINATFCRTGESVCTGPGNVMMAGIGAGIGAAIGALVSR